MNESIPPTPKRPDASQPPGPLKRRRWPLVLVVVAFICAAFGLGVTVADTYGRTSTSSTTTVDPAPAETVTETVVETETETVTVTPQACADAIDIGWDLVSLTGDTSGLVAEVFGEVGAILNADGFMVTSEWNAINDTHSTELGRIVDRHSDLLDAYTETALACIAGG